MGTSIDVKTDGKSYQVNFKNKNSNIGNNIISKIPSKWKIPYTAVKTE